MAVIIPGLSVMMKISVPKILAIIFQDVKLKKLVVTITTLVQKMIVTLRQDVSITI
jgi:hypothetical protein